MTQTFIHQPTYEISNIQYTFGANVYRVAGTDTTTWKSFTEGTLANWSRLPHASDKESKKNYFWISPAVIRSERIGITKTNIDHMSAWAAFDIDRPGWDMCRIAERLDGYAHCIYTTTQSRPGAQRWRIIVPMDRDYSTTEHESIWPGFDEIFYGELDPSTKNCNRLHFAPAKWEGADNVFKIVEGEVFPVDVFVSSFPPAPPPAPLAQVAMSVAPNGVEIITAEMVVQEYGKPKGGRLFKLMCVAAARFKRNGWSLSSHDLESAARCANAFIDPGDQREGLLKEAQRAIEWANANVVTKPITHNILKWRRI